MRTQWTTKGNQDTGSSCLCNRGLHRYLRNFGGGFELPNQIRHCKTVCIKRNLYLINYNPMRTQWTTKGNQDTGSSCLCNRGLHRYLWNFGGGLNTPPSVRHCCSACQFWMYQMIWGTLLKITSFWNVTPCRLMLLTFQMNLSQYLLDQGWQTYGKWRDFLGTQHLLLSQFVLFLCPTSISLSIL